MTKKSKSKKEEDYNLTIVWPDPIDPKQHKRITWHNVRAPGEQLPAATIAKIKMIYPTACHANLYGGLTEVFKKQFKFI